MELVIGGYAQGKVGYVLKRYGLSQEDVTDTLDGTHRVVNRLDQIIREKYIHAENVKDIVLNYADQYPDTIFICNEVGCGLVPMEREQREIRDLTGQICCLLAERAVRVHRVICGIGSLLKGSIV